MRPAIRALADYVSKYSPVLLPAALFLATTTSELLTPIPHSLLISSLAWALLWAQGVFRVGLSVGSQNVPRKRLSWAAGALFALAQICARAALDREALWWTKTLLPASVFVILQSNLLLGGDGSLSSDRASTPDPALSNNSSRLLAVFTISAGLSLSASFVTSQNAVLGLSSVLFAASAFIALENAIHYTKDEKYAGARGFVMANGSFSRRSSSASHQQENPGSCLRDAAAVVAVVCGVAAFMTESFRADPLTFNLQVNKLGGDWRLIQNSWMRLQVLISIIVVALQNALLFAMINQRRALFTSIVVLLGYMAAGFLTRSSLWNTWFSVLSVLSLIAFVDDSSSGTPSSTSRSSRRLKYIISLMSFSSLLLLISLAFRSPVSYRYLQYKEPAPLLTGPPPALLEPLKLVSDKVHPVQQLIQAAEPEFAQLQERQSKSLKEAVAEYRRRYKIHPPPHFDAWYELAKKKGVQLIDEFDTIYHLLLPFWGLEPATIRARAREALGNDENMLIAMLIRDGEVVKIERGEEWQQQATIGMVKEFVKYLPDMDLAFNIHDEPRVAVPHDRLSMLVNKALNVRFPKVISNASPKNGFSSRPKDMNDGKALEEVKYTRFNKFAHQATWTHSRISCPPDSPARSYEEIPADNLTSYALSELGFVYNQTAFMDICMSPSLSETYGFFDRPNAYNLVQELFPIFSQSKIGSYQDIIYPSPWYWFGKVQYDEQREFDWDVKNNSLYWRGSTTGGFSKRGGWRRQHRQHVVGKLNAHDTGKIMTNSGGSWQPTDVKRDEFRDIIDVKFSHVGQCEDADCDAQKEFFEVTERVDGQDAWRWKHLLDMDGNAFSGRFYAFLKSKSLVYKMAIFQEWHMDWLKPWVHYIPFSLRGDEWLETVRYFSSEEEGKAEAPRMAMQSREWANKALRNEDFEVWFFRLLLEYGRVIDDDREKIGYPGP